MMAAALFASAGHAQSVCDRVCLEGFVNRYLDALVAHDAKRLPVTPDVKFTEDDVSLKLGEALWRTATGMGNYKLYFADPPAAAKRPFNVDVGEAFKIVNGKIRKVEALMTALPYGAKSPFVPQ